ncbi:hypothetical protein SELMODRAFT_423435 [Selaginella moellendorffii]|uniref:Protein kinase domain-containing protein n=1 Tax=Selaginella moellendorffii TaxID=88036 RepID=D8SLP9_SELML|nr:hypothetical protein SELMODRAFT_423435 [Selaginella moellendorffii]
MVREINIGSKAMRVGAMLLLLAFLILAIFPAASEPKKVVCHGEDRCLEMDDEVNLAAEWGSFFLDVEIVGGEIGRGAFGRVYNARYPNDSQAYVAKVVMMLDEVRLASAYREIYFGSRLRSEQLQCGQSLRKSWVMTETCGLYDPPCYNTSLDHVGRFVEAFQEGNEIYMVFFHEGKTATSLLKTRSIKKRSFVTQLTSSKTLYRGIGPLRNGESDMRYTAPEARFIDDYRFYLHEGEAFDMWMVGVTLLEVFMGNRSAILPTTLQMQMAWQIDYGMPPRSVAYLLGLSNFCVFPPDKILAGELLETMALQTARCVNQSALSHGFPNKLALELVQSLLRWSPVPLGALGVRCDHIPSLIGSSLPRALSAAPCALSCGRNQAHCRTAMPPIDCLNACVDTLFPAPWWQGLVTSANLESSLLIPTELFLAPTESEGKAVEIRSYIDRIAPAEELRYYLHTVVVVDVTFGVKELKVSEADMQLFFDKAGSCKIHVLPAAQFFLLQSSVLMMPQMPILTQANERSAQQLFGKYLSNWIAADTNEESNVDGFCAQATSPGMKRGCWCTQVREHDADKQINASIVLSSLLAAALFLRSVPGSVELTLIATEPFLAPTESEGNAVELRTYIDSVKKRKLGSTLYWSLKTIVFKRLH